MDNPLTSLGRRIANRVRPWERERTLDLSNALLGKVFDSLLAASVEAGGEYAADVHLWLAEAPTPDELHSISEIETEFIAQRPLDQQPKRVHTQLHIGYPHPDEEALPGRLVFLRERA